LTKQGVFGVGECKFVQIRFVSDHATHAIVTTVTNIWKFEYKITINQLAYVSSPLLTTIKQQI